MRDVGDRRGLAEFTLAEYNMFDYMPHWIQPLVGTPDERAAKLRDPAAREAMKQDVERFPHARTDWRTISGNYYTYVDLPLPTTVVPGAYRFCVTVFDQSDNSATDCAPYTITSS